MNHRAARLIAQRLRSGIADLQRIRAAKLLLDVRHGTHLRRNVGLEADRHGGAVALVELVALGSDEIENILGRLVRVIQLNTRRRL